MHYGHSWQLSMTFSSQRFQVVHVYFSSWTPAEQPHPKKNTEYLALQPNMFCRTFHLLDLIKLEVSKGGANTTWLVV